MIYADFESILEPEDNGEKQDPHESQSNKYQKHVSNINSCAYKSVCVDDKFSKSFKSFLGENAFSDLINSMNEESKYSSDVIKAEKNVTKMEKCCIN